MMDRAEESSRPSSSTHENSKSSVSGSFSILKKRMSRIEESRNNFIQDPEPLKTTTPPDKARIKITDNVSPLNRIGSIGSGLLNTHKKRMKFNLFQETKLSDDLEEELNFSEEPNNETKKSSNSIQDNDQIESAKKEGEGSSPFDFNRVKTEPQTTAATPPPTKRVADNRHIKVKEEEEEKGREKEKEDNKESVSDDDMDVTDEGAPATPEKKKSKEAYMQSLERMTEPKPFVTSRRKSRLVPFPTELQQEEQQQQQQQHIQYSKVKNEREQHGHHQEIKSGFSYVSNRSSSTSGTRHSSPKDDEQQQVNTNKFNGTQIQLSHMKTPIIKSHQMISSQQQIQLSQRKTPQINTTQNQSQILASQMQPPQLQTPQIQPPQLQTPQIYSTRQQQLMLTQQMNSIPQPPLPTPQQPQILSQVEQQQQQQPSFVTSSTTSSSSSSVQAAQQQFFDLAAMQRQAFIPGIQPQPQYYQGMGMQMPPQTPTGELTVRGGKMLFTESINSHRMRIINNKPYLELNEIGRGASSRVFKVLGLDFKTYALKRVTFKDAGQEQEAAIKNMMEEIKLMEKLKGNPLVIQLVDYQFCGHVAYIVMELGEVDLAKLLAASKGRNIDMNVIRVYWQQMLRSVDAVHEADIIHADLKPQNFVLVNGTWKLIDFGISKEMRRDSTHVTMGLGIGTPNYLSPEVLNHGRITDNKVKVTKAADTWSLGCILYQLVFGKTPFQDLPDMHKYQAIVNPNYEIKIPPDDYKGDLPGSLVGVLKGCLRREPKERLSIKQLLEHPFLTGNTFCPHCPHCAAHPTASEEGGEYS